MEEKETLFESAQKRVVGFSRTCGLRLSAVEPGDVRGYCPLHEGLLNPFGYVHGGAVNTLMDTLSGMAATWISSPPRYVVTRSADVHYLLPIRGERMSGRARVIRSGGHACLVQAEVFDEQDRLCATGLLEFYYLDAAL